MTKHFLCALLTVAGCAAITGVLYWKRTKKWQEVWGQVPQSTWEQLASRIKYGDQLPLDAPQILADVDEWLQGGDLSG